MNNRPKVVPPPKDAYLKQTNVKAELHEVPLNTAVQALCRDKGISCVPVRSNIPVSISYNGSVFNFLKLLSKQTGYKFTYNGTLKLVK